MGKKKKQQKQFSEDFVYLLVIFVTLSAGIAYLFYSMGYANAVREQSLQRMKIVQKVSYLYGN